MVKKLLIVLTLTLLSSCLSRIEKRGYSFELTDYEVSKGLSSKNEISNNMGSPTIINYIDGNVFWVYFEEKVRKLLFFKPRILEREILVISFDTDGIVKSLDKYNLRNKQNIKFLEKKTKIKEVNKGFFSELFGNIGQVKPQ